MHFFIKSWGKLEIAKQKETLRDWYLSREIDDVRSKMYDVRGKRDDGRGMMLE